jgi:hypothetical protein
MKRVSLTRLKVSKFSVAKWLKGRNGWHRIVFIRLAGSREPDQTVFQGECKMKVNMPSSISGWCMWLFFLCFGLAPFVAVLGTIAPWLALAYAVLSFIGL